MNLKNYLFLAILALGAPSAFAAAPTISGFSPASSTLNATVTITGTNFVAPVTVSFNGVASASVTVVSSTSVKAIVPFTAASGAIALADSGGSATSTSAFTVVPGLVTSTTVGPPTTGLTLYYSGFSSREAVDLYFDTEDIALSTTSATGAGNIPVTIPADAHPGAHWISAVGRHSGDAVQIPFTVRASWPQFGFAPNHKGKNRYENVLSAASVIDLDQAWQTPYIGDVGDTPAVVNGIVYAGFGDNTIRAFDETTGAQKWSYMTGGYTGFSSPAVSNGIVYAGSGDGYLYALDAVTGALKWRCATEGEIYSSPNVVNGIVYVGSYDKNIYAVNATTGAVVWSFPTANIVFSSPMVANGVVYVGSYDDNVYALNAATGAKIWAFATTGAVPASPVMAAGLICVGSNSGIFYGLYPSGSEAWSYSTGSILSGPAAAVGSAIFFSTVSGTVYCLSSGGALRWSRALPDGTTCDGPLCVANGVVYVTDSSDTYALDQNTGAVLATLPAGGVYAGPAVVNGAVFVANSNVGALARFTPNALLSNFVAPRPDPMQLRPHHLR